jgi:hypothetical protein
MAKGERWAGNENALEEPHIVCIRVSKPSSQRARRQDLSPAPSNKADDHTGGEYEVQRLPKSGKTTKEKMSRRETKRDSPPKNIPYQ